MKPSHNALTTAVFVVLFGSHVMLLILRERPIKTNQASSSLIIPRAAERNADHVSTGTNTVVEFLRINIGGDTGEYVAVASDRNSVIARIRTGGIIWSNNLAPFALERRPLGYVGRIDSMTIVSNVLVIRMGKMYVEMSIENGEVIDSSVY